MYIYLSNLHKVILITFVLFFSFSCSKDSDLLADYIAEESKDMLVNDAMVTLANQSIVIVPKIIDAYENPINIIVTGTTPPKMGTTVVNGDNTITYTPDTDITGTDEFNYTAVITNPDNTETKQTGQITVTVTNKPPTDDQINYGELKAFPSAHGFGRYATGGRGGIVIPVTNLNDNGKGSLREALNSSETRTIVFKVSGTINLSSAIRVKNPNFTIAGETAPGQGIQIAGSGGVQIEAGNFIVRHLKFRGSSVISNLRIISANGQPINNGMIDHCSFSWPDEAEMNIAFETSTDRLDVKNITIQNSILGEATRGIILYKGPYRISVYRNLFVNIQTRAVLSNYPEYSPENELGFEEINNIIHNIQTNPVQASFGTKYTAIGNKRSNSSTSRITVNHFLGLYTGGEGIHSNSYIYHYDNINSSGSIYNTITAPFLKDSPFDTTDIVGNLIIPSSDIDGILPTLGAFYWNRDETDKRFVNDYLNNSGALGTYKRSVPALKEGTAYIDSDGDGISDEWEIANGLNPKSPDNNGYDLNTKYTNLEMFLHVLAKDN